MQDIETRLKELLACYGSAPEQWPEDEQKIWRQAQRQPKALSLIEDEKDFELLLAKRGTPMPTHGFSQRIIAASLARPQVIETGGWFSDLISEVRPAALAAMLVFGFAIGFGVVAHQPAFNQGAFVKAFTDDEGTIL